MRGEAIAIDVDGVIFEYDRWKGVEDFGKVVEGTREALQKLKDQGFKIIIYSTRLNPEENVGYSPQDLYDILFTALRGNQIPFDKIETKGKPLAKYYIDDRAIKFQNWNQVLEDIKNLEGE